MTTYYLQGSGTANDAVFEVFANGNVRVTAEVGMTGCYDDLMPCAEARAVWQQLTAAGWKRIETPRRSARAISASING